MSRAPSRVFRRAFRVPRRILPWMVLACLGLAGTAAASPEPPPPGWDASRFMGVDELRPGMKGVGRSVFKDARVEEFQAEILGVLETATPEGTMILARLSGQGLEESGIIAGMSGSPVFVDGRLIGAVAFGWAFSSQPIAGITPVAGMLDLSRRAQAGVGDRASTPGLPPAIWEALWSARGEKALDVLLGGEREPATGWSPLAVPMSLGGLSPGAKDLASRLAERMGFVAVEGGAAGSAPDLDAGFEPGSAVAVELVRGDASLAAIGTVTWKEGGRVWAFGHPLLNSGATAYPMAPARIIAVMPRYSSSFKMGAVGPAAGAITGDYTTGVVGEVGQSPRMIPMTLSLDFGSRKEELAFEILDAEGLTPSLAALVASSGLDAFGRSAGAATLRLEVTVGVEGGRDLHGSAVAAGFSPPASLAGEVARLVGLVSGNPFENVRLSRIGVQATVSDTIEAAFIERVTADPGPFHPGESLPLRVELRDYRGRTWVEETSVTIPPETPAGSYKVAVCDGIQASRLEEERAPGAYAPRSFDQMRAILSQGIPGDRLVIRLLDTTANPIVLGAELPRLPGSMRSAVEGPHAETRPDRRTQGSVIAERQVKLGRVLLGCQTLPVTVAPAR